MSKHLCNFWGYVSIVAVVVAACSGPNRSGDPIAEVQPIPPDEGIEVTLFYDDVSLVVFNGNETDMAKTNRLTFVRGDVGGTDDFAGDDIPGDVVRAGACFRITQQGRAPQNPPQCSAVASEEFLSDPNVYFWRAEPVGAATFDIRLDGTIIGRCDTVARGEIGECRFTYPAAS